jgi:bla regulator protein BlaR1
MRMLRCVRVAVAVCIWIAAATAYSQPPAAAGTAKDAAPAAAPAVDPTMGIAFDVVSIRHTGQGFSRVINPADGDGITITNSTLREIVQWNYGVKVLREDQVLGAPGWFSSIDENYEIHAKVAPEDVPAWQKLDEEARRLVFRKVLTDRFKFACHFVEVEVPVYNLVTAKGGLKMKEAKPGEVSPYHLHQAGDPNTPLTSEGVTGRLVDGRWITVMQRQTMAWFATDFLDGPAGRPVIDKTGLTGVYNFTLDFSWQQLSANPSAQGASEPSSPDIFAALQEQLGLKLEPARALVSHLVIDHIERPAEN